MFKLLLNKFEYNRETNMDNTEKNKQNGQPQNVAFPKGLKNKTDRIFLHTESDGESYDINIDAF